MKRMVLMILALGLSFSAQTARADWTPTKRLTWTSGYVQNPTIAVDRWGKIHLVWYDDTPGNSEIYYKNSPDRGATWTLSKRITWTEGDSIAPAIAIDYPGNLHVVWYANTTYKDGIYYKKSTDGETLGRCPRGSPGLLEIPGIRPSLLLPLKISMCSGPMGRPGTMRFISGRARMGEPPGQLPKGSPGIRAIPGFWPFAMPMEILVWSGRTIRPGTRRFIT